MSDKKNADVADVVKSRIDKVLLERFKFCPDVYLTVAFTSHSSNEDELAVAVLYNKYASSAHLSLLKSITSEIPCMGVQIQFVPDEPYLEVHSNQPCA